MPDKGRLLVSTASDSTDSSLIDNRAAAMNMAIDQALLESVPRPLSDNSGPPPSAAQPTLRIYQWAEPTLSLGYFQKLAARKQHQESIAAHCVRRSSGGGAILHHHELTYCLVFPNCWAVPEGGEPNARSGANEELYRHVHQATIDALAEFGVAAQPYRIVGPGLVTPPIEAVTDRQSSEGRFLCFQRRTDEDLIVSGYKVCGSAQRRGKHALLQHGSLLFRASPYAPQLPGIVNLGAKVRSLADFARTWVSKIGDQLSISWTCDSLSPEEHLEAQEIAKAKYGEPKWLSKR